MRSKFHLVLLRLAKPFVMKSRREILLFGRADLSRWKLNFLSKPGTDDEWLDYWKEERFHWYAKYGIKQEKITLRQYAADELALCQELL